MSGSEFRDLTELLDVAQASYLLLDTLRTGITFYAIKLSQEIIFFCLHVNLLTLLNQLCLLSPSYLYAY